MVQRHVDLGDISRRSAGGALDVQRRAMDSTRRPGSSKSPQAPLNAFLKKKPFDRLDMPETSATLPTPRCCVL